MEICLICASWPSTCSSSSVHPFSLFSLAMMHSKFPTFSSPDAQKWVIAQLMNLPTFTLIIPISRIKSENWWSSSLILLFGLHHALFTATSIVEVIEIVKSCKCQWIQDTHSKEQWRCSQLESRMIFTSGSGSTTSCGLRTPLVPFLVLTTMMTLPWSVPLTIIARTDVGEWLICYYQN